jgi:hypothetical protein
VESIEVAASRTMNSTNTVRTWLQLRPTCGSSGPNTIRPLPSPYPTFPEREPFARPRNPTTLYLEIVEASSLRAQSRMSAAKGTLQRASFFVDRAEIVGPGDRVAFQHFLEAAIVFARSVTLHLQKEYSHNSGFDAWYDNWQQKLKADSLARFFLEQRNYVLKQGPLQISKHVVMHLQSTVTITGSLTIKVIRGHPWYRRSPHILWSDAFYPIRAKLRQLRQRLRRSRPAETKSSPAKSTETLRFAEAPWSDHPALDLLRRYLRTLADVVEEAEKKFEGNPSSGT